MSIEMLTKNSFDGDIKEMLERIDEMKPSTDLYSLIVEENFVVECV